MAFWMAILASLPKGESRAEESLKCCPTGGLGDFAHLSQVLYTVSVRAPNLAGTEDFWAEILLCGLQANKKDWHLQPTQQPFWWKIKQAEIFQHLCWGHLITVTWLHVSS